MSCTCKILIKIDYYNIHAMQVNATGSASGPPIERKHRIFRHNKHEWRPLGFLAFPWEKQQRVTHRNNPMEANNILRSWSLRATDVYHEIDVRIYRK